MNDLERLLESSPMLRQLWREFGEPAAWWGVAALLACLLAAWWLAGRLRRRAHRGDAAVPAGSRGALLGVVVGSAWADRVAFPLIALVLAFLVGRVLQPHLPVHVFVVAGSLLLAMVLIRALVLLVRQAIGASAGWIAAFEKTIATTIWVGVALHLLGLLPGLLQALEDLAVPIGKTRISALHLLQGAVTVALALTVALWLSRLLDARLARSGAIDSSLRVVLGRLATALLCLLAILIALPAVGLDLTALSVFGGALGVGLGFGMQKIAANYVSGFIILLDKSISIDRMVRVDKYRGRVTEIRTRYTVLRALDGVEAIVPNEQLVSSVVESESFSDSRMRIAVRVGVGYASDVERAMAVLVEVARAHPRALAEPPPRAFLVQFADSSIVLELGLWIDDPEEGTLALVSELNLAILRRFRAEGIEIPYPQRDVRLVGGPPAAA